MAQRAAGQPCKPALDGVEIDPNRGPDTTGPSLPTEPLGSRAGELERVRLHEARLVAAGLDPGNEPELVEQLADLLDAAWIIPT